MNKLILPGQENLSQQQLQAAAQKQELLLALNAWREFLEAKDQSNILATQVGIDLTKGGFPLEVVEKIWQGGNLIRAEQATGATKTSQTPNPDILLALAAQNCTILVGIASQAPQVVGNPMFRAVLLAFQVGILSVQTSNTKDISSSS